MSGDDGREEGPPPGPQRFVSGAKLLEAFRGLPRIDAELFRRDVDSILDQSIEPRVGREEGQRTGREE